MYCLPNAFATSANMRRGLQRICRKTISRSIHRYICIYIYIRTWNRHLGAKCEKQAFWVSEFPHSAGSGAVLLSRQTWKVYLTHDMELIAEQHTQFQKAAFLASEFVRTAHSYWASADLRGQRASWELTPPLQDLDLRLIEHTRPIHSHLRVKAVEYMIRSGAYQYQSFPKNPRRTAPNALWSAYSAARLRDAEFWGHRLSVSIGAH